MIIKMIENGMIQVYTGNGKGKTTAALGQGLRAVGNNNKVYMVQFLKSFNTSELETLKKLEPNFKVFRFEKQRDFIWNLSNDEIEEVKIEIKGAFNFVEEVIHNRQCDMLILDEIMGVLKHQFINIHELIKVLMEKPDNMEIILTGRDAPTEIVEIANYVSSVDCVKHPFNEGVAARKGIEY